MAVHVPLSDKAVTEARELMLATKNLLKPANGEPIISPSKDMVLGVYYLTMEVDEKQAGDPRAFSSIDEVLMAYSMGLVHVHEKIKLLTETWYDQDNTRMENPATRIIETTVGRTIFNNALTERMRFYNHELDKNGVRDLVAEVYDICGQEETCIIADQIKDIGFQYATRSGITIAIADINVPASKAEILQAAQEKVDEIDQSLERGITTEDERNKIVGDIWEETGHQVTVEVEKALDPMGDLTTMAKSGASKGGINAISQLAGMKGLVSDPSGRAITMPICSNYREGMTPFEYYISTHGARKGLADTALRTADAGYLTRRLVDVAQDVIVNEEDCGTYQGIWINADDNIAGQSFEKRLYGRVLADRVINPETGEIVFNRNDLLTHDRVKIIKELGISAVHVRSPLTCEMIHGICANCYGMDLARGEMVKLGSTVGIIAAQSIGEPGTQLTLWTFHTGGVVAGGDITSAFPCRRIV